MHGSSAVRKTFDPRDILGCRCWLRSDRGIALASGNVVSWANQVSGVSGDATAPDAGHRPVYNVTGGLNGHPRISFGTGLGLDWALDLQDASTVVLVLRQNSEPGGSNVHWHYLIRGSTGPVFTTRVAINIAGYTRQSWVGNAVVAGSNGVGYEEQISGAGHILITTYNGGTPATVGNYSALQDGASKTIVASSLFQVNNCPSCIGYFKRDNLYFSDSDFYEVIVYDRVLTGQEQMDVWGYAKARYNI